MVVVNGTAHSGACPKISFRAAYLSECLQRCPSDRRNHLAPFRNLQLLLRRHSAIGTRATTADRWCSTQGKRALRRAFLPMHLASSSATGRSTGLCTSGCPRRLCSTCLTCFGLFWDNLQMSFVTAHTSMIDVADLSMFLLLQTPSKAAKPPAAMAVERVVTAKALVIKSGAPKNDRSTIFDAPSHAHCTFTSTPPQEESQRLSSSANPDSLFFVLNHGQTHLFRHGDC